MTLDPEVRDLAAAIVDLDDRLRGIDDRERSTALAYLAGVLRGVARGQTSPATATVVLAAYQPGHVDRELADAAAGEPAPAEVPS